jgi:hypothetical protein
MILKVSGMLLRNVRTMLTDPRPHFFRMCPEPDIAAGLYPCTPRYFFNVFYDRTEVDSVGEELPDKHAAWKEATVTAGQLLQSLDGKLQPGQDWQMEVTDEFANPLHVIHVSAKQSFETE